MLDMDRGGRQLSNGIKVMKIGASKKDHKMVHFTFPSRRLRPKFASNKLSTGAMNWEIHIMLLRQRNRFVFRDSVYPIV